MIEILNAQSASLTPENLKQLYDIIIKGYELTEEEVWGKNYIRIFPDEYQSIISAGEILVAKYHGRIVGGIRYYCVDDSSYGFSLLATDFKYAGLGIGTALIRAAEDKAIAAGAKIMAIEILRVRGLEVKSKQVLASYYEKLGYRYTHSADCSCKIPTEKYKRLAAPSDFDFYEKVLSK